MKKLLLFAVCALALAACNQDKKKFNSAMLQNDSLRAIIEARDAEINDMMGTLNDIQEGFRSISEAENRVTLMKNGESADKASQMKADIQFIAQRMNENRELIKKLQQQLRETGFKGDQMKKTIDEMTILLTKKENELQKLREELDRKDIHIAELDETVNKLNTNVATLTTEKENLTTEKENLQNDNAQKAQTISTQDKQLNTAWYVFGTKKELKDQKIISDGKVLQGSFNKNYFTKIDIRVEKEIKLYSKGARILTTHPASSYTLSKDTSGQYVLRITDPNTFWSTSKYLVVQVK
jgi:chromosome segregation ATPase